MNQVEVEQYVAGVRAALADLPENVREELLEDLPEHLADVAAESESGVTSLRERLGSPEAYAAELRAAAGLAAPPRRRLPHSVVTVVGQARDGLGRLDSLLGPIFGYARASELLRLLRPAWWVLRGYAVGMIVMSSFSGKTGLLPDFGGWFVVGAGVLASVHLGRRTDRLPRWTRAVVAGLGVIIGFLALAQVNKVDTEWAPVDYNTERFQYVRDVYPYDENGRPLKGVRLYDQNGTAIDLGEPSMCTNLPYPWPTPRPYPRCPDSLPFPTAEPGGGPSGSPGPSAPSGSPGPSESPVPSGSPSGR